MENLVTVKEVKEDFEVRELKEVFNAGRIAMKLEILEVLEGYATAKAGYTMLLTEVFKNITKDIQKL